MSRTPAITPGQFSSFGELLKYLRRRAGFTQRELSIAVGYSDTQISRLEQNQRIPDQVILSAQFIPGLKLEHDQEWAKRLLELAALSKQNFEKPQAAGPALLDRIVKGSLIGRQKELNELYELWERALQGPAHLALISGEPGIGKTRLIREVLRQAKMSGAATLAGGCYEYEAIAPYLPFVEALRTWAEAQTTHDLRQLLGSTTPEVAKLIPEIETRLGSFAPNPPLSPNAERLRLFDNLARFFQTLASSKGLLVILDDLHWADEGTLALLHYLLRRLRETHILFLAAYREVELDRTHPLSAALVEWNRERLATRVALGRLSARETGLMLEALLGEANVSLEFSNAIHRETEGNPFFIEEVIKALIEQGEIYRVDSGWERKAIADLTIPQSIKDAIGWRLNRLSAGCVDVLHIAAALGKVFTFQDLAAVASSSEDQLLDALDEAGSAQLTRAEINETFAFTHDKIREVLYEELNSVRRRRLHQRIGEALEKLYSQPGAHEAHIPDLAYHFIQSGDLQKGMAYSLEAAEQAKAVFALDESIRYYQHAIESAEVLNLPRQLSLIHEKIGDINFQRGSILPAIEHYQQALRLMTPEEPTRRAYLNSRIGEFYLVIDDERGLSFLQLAEQGLDPLTQADELALVLAYHGRYHHFRSEPYRAIEYYERGLKLAGPLNSKSAVIINAFLAGTYLHLAKFAESRNWALKEIELGEKINNPFATALGYENLAENALEQGNWADGLQYAARDKELGEKIGALERVGWAELSSSQALFHSGDLRQSLKVNREAMRLAEQTGEKRLQLWLGPYQIMIETDLGLDDSTQAAAGMWINRADEIGELIFQCWARQGLAYFHLQRSEWAQANEIYEQCAALFANSQYRLPQLRLGPCPAEARLGLKRLDQAAQLVSNYLTFARETGAPHYVGCTLRVQGQIFAAQGQSVQAAAAFEEAFETLDKLGSRLELGRTLYHRGLFRRSNRQPASARDDLEQALVIFETCGASRDLERTKDLLNS